MKVLLLGSGGRESALAYKIKQSSKITELKVYPGNGGFSKSEIIPKNFFDLKNKNSTVQFIQKEKFDLVIVGPEEPLVDGIADWLEEVKIPCFGPSKYCAQLEGSKDFAKQLMKEFSIPTAQYETFNTLQLAKDYCMTHSLPIVVKADGLAAGKGVTVCETLEIANSFLDEIFIDQKFGQDPKVVIEEFLVGEEASIFAISDGEKFIILPALQDHKRAYENDLGPNTGGMGAYSPAPIATKKILEQVKKEIFEKMILGLKEKGYPYKGLLYAGLMIQNDYAKVIEFNCRFGDPETQALMLLIEDDLLQILFESANGNLQKKEILIKEGFAAVVVLAALGYPNVYTKNIPIELNSSPSVQIFHAGTQLNSENQIVSSGGRVLGLSCQDKDLKSALDSIYDYLNANPVQNTFYRKDIGKKAL